MAVLCVILARQHATDVVVTGALLPAAAIAFALGLGWCRGSDAGPSPTLPPDDCDIEVWAELPNAPVS